MASNDVLPQHWSLAFRLVLDWHRLFGWQHRWQLLPSGLIVHLLEKGERPRRRLFLTRDTTIDRGFSSLDRRTLLRIPIGDGTLDRVVAYARDPHDGQRPDRYRTTPDETRVFHGDEDSVFSILRSDLPTVQRIAREGIGQDFGA